MHTWTTLAEQLIHARPATEDDGREVLEYLARREGKMLDQVVEEIRTSEGASTRPTPSPGLG